MSEPLRGTLVVGQSGGPTPVINASRAGAIREAQGHGCFTGILGLVHGIEGALKGQLLDLGGETPDGLNLLSRTPASALGSCWHKLSEADCGRILEAFRSHGVRHFVYIGACVHGNRQLALQALLLDPMINDIDTARAILDDFLTTFSQYMPQFA